MILFGLVGILTIGSATSLSLLPEHVKNMHTTIRKETTDDMIIVRFIKTIRFFVAKIVKKDENKQILGDYYFFRRGLITLNSKNTPSGVL